MKNKNRIFLFIPIFLISFTIITPFALGATRQTYLLNYIYSEQNGNNGFGDSHESTLRALEILNDFSALGGVNSGVTQQYLRSELERMLDNNQLNVYDLYYILKSIDILNNTDTEVYVSLRNRIITYLEGLNQTGGGFSPTNATGSSPTMITTYFALESYSILLDGAFEVMDIHKNWTLDCRDSSTGGYKGNISASTPSLLNTYCAISIINKAEKLGELVNRSKTINYCTSFFVSTVSDQNNYGGYLPDLSADYALLSSTFYSIQILKLLSSEPQRVPSINWIFSRQNFRDGGFADIGDETVQSYSSIVSSYFAFKSLSTLEASLDTEIWMVEFNYIILIVVFIIITIIIGVAIFFWRKRKL